MVVLQCRNDAAIQAGSPGSGRTDVSRTGRAAVTGGRIDSQGERERAQSRLFKRLFQGNIGGMQRQGFSGIGRGTLHQIGGCLTDFSSHPENIFGFGIKRRHLFMGNGPLPKASIQVSAIIPARREIAWPRPHQACTVKACASSGNTSDERPILQSTANELPVVRCPFFDLHGLFILKDPGIVKPFSPLDKEDTLAHRCQLVSGHTAAGTGADDDGIVPIGYGIRWGHRSISDKKAA